ncbi:DUF2442 domain-containing protein [Salegentibacter sp. Hel_I_6]|uniref:DUF2442 domain-containing protein n=1 Tax=Salegentibacter sp. Hel_I_6 TaxID=1250278 RepID=UPI00055D9909|nr:DUF2442 domain-containing protein [Salegentibacter sp. Hel_I_6]
MKVIRIISADYLEDYKIKLKFNDGLEKRIDLEKELYGEIFEPLKNMDYFKNFSLNHFTIEWPNGADFAPEFLYNYNKELV